MGIRLKYLAIFILFCAIYNLGYSQSLHINELMSSNLQIIKDEDGDFSDWIELINTSSSAINLADYYLSDDLDNPTQWRFPSYELSSGEILLVFASGKDRSDMQNMIKWETIVDLGDEIKYIIPDQEITDWRDKEFDDSSWQSGSSGIGYGDNDDQTIIASSVCLYLRKSFSISDLPSIHDFVLHMDYDDSFVAYINGVEVARSGIGTIGTFPSFNQEADYDNEAKIYQGLSPEKFVINNPENILTEGTNVLAIEVHNISNESSDLSAIPFISIGSTSLPNNSISDYLYLTPSYFHTNFKLSSNGDSLLIYNTQQQIVDQLIYEPFPVNYSVGYSDEDFSTLNLFANPTPGKPNTSPAITYDASIVPSFSKEGGIYTSSISVSLTSENASDEIYYTTDGSEPSVNSNLYSSAFTLNNPTTIKAKIIHSDNTYGKTITQSYYPNYDKELPIVFLSTAPDNLWDEEKGIYVLGNDAESAFPHYGANYYKDWEKPAHIELYYPDNRAGFNVNVGIKIHGAGSKVYPQKSFNIYARSKYGDSNIPSKIFENRTNEKFESIVLRNSGNDNVTSGRTTGTQFRDMLMSEVAIGMDIDAAAGFPCIVYINGDYWGIYNVREKLTENFISDNNFINDINVDVVENDTAIINGSNEDYLELKSFIETNDMSNSSNYNYVGSKMDIPNFIRNNITEIFFDNWDWPGNNVRIWRDNNTPGKWKWIFNDSDFGMGLYDVYGRYDHNTLEMATDPSSTEWPNPQEATLVLRKLLTNNDFTHEFINTFADHLNTSFLTNSINSLIIKYSSKIETEIPTHAYTWGTTEENWVNALDIVTEFSVVRPDTVRGFIREYFSISQNQNVVISTQGSDDASIQINSISIDQFPWEGIYFNQIPIELTALAPSGYEFIRWEGDVSSTNANIQIPMDSDINVTAVFDENPEDIRDYH